MTITPIPIEVVYTIIEMINEHDFNEVVTIDGTVIDRKARKAPYAIGKPFRTLQIQLYNQIYCIDDGMAYLKERCEEDMPNDCNQ